MAETFAYVCKEEARLLHSSIGEMSAPKGVQGAAPKFSATFGISESDFKAIVKLEIEAIKSEMGEFSGNPADYYLACTSGETAAKRTLAKAELDCRGKPADEVFKIKEKAEKRAALYRQYAGILSSSTKFGIGLARLEAGKVVSIAEDHLTDLSEEARKKAGNDFFYPGAWAAPSIKLQGFRRKSMDAKDGVTSFLQNILYFRKGERLGGGGPDNKDVFGGFAGYSPKDPTALAPGGEGEGAGGDFSNDLDDEIAF